MKLSTSLGLLPLIAAASLVGVGCKTAPKNVTPIPHSGAGPGDRTQAPPPISTPIRNQGPGTGVPLAPGGGTGGRDLPIESLNDGKDVTDPLPENLRYGRPEDRAMFAAETVYFEYDRATLKASEDEKVKRVAEFLKGNPLHDLAVEGHCDERGTEEYNRALAERRALSVREALINLGISGSRVTTTSFGEDQPADPGHDDSAWQKNRRGEFIILLPASN